ncbi:MAG: beta-ketoacyl-ACP synthase III [Dehalococcoidia bacterium]|nr:beta-ketoacyl-ACP synthase III [Dehalococcoidia bacterium]
MNQYACITGWGMYVPERILTNAELEQIVDTSDDWIVERTGIRERRVVADDETASTMAVRAARKALDEAGLSAQDVDLIVVATVSPDNYYPSCACQVQDALGSKKAAAFDVGAGCSGFLYALSTATQFIASGAYRNALVIGAEAFTRTLNWQDRNTCVLFGDGAGALVLQACQEPYGLCSFLLGSDGSGGKLLYLRNLCARPGDWPENGRPQMYMDGREVFKFAVGAMVDTTREAIKRAGLKLSDIDLFIPHQANYRIISSMARFLKLPADKVVINIDRYGNTVSASIPIALCEAIQDGRVKDGDRLVLVSFGTGFTWAGLVLRWGVPAEVGKRALSQIGAARGESQGTSR